LLCLSEPAAPIETSAYAAGILALPCGVDEGKSRFRLKNSYIEASKGALERRVLAKNQ
jgi:hypothetical protein